MLSSCRQALFPRFADGSEVDTRQAVTHLDAQLPQSVQPFLSQRIIHQRPGIMRICADDGRIPHLCGDLPKCVMRIGFHMHGPVIGSASQVVLQRDAVIQRAGT